MAGTAQTNRFLLSSATLMIGQMSKVYDLSPLNDSVGLVKNFSLMADPTFLDLTQGSKNTVVFSTMTASPVKATAEVYEYTAKNLAYGLSLDGTAMSTQSLSFTQVNAMGVDQNSVNTSIDLNDGAIALGINVGDYLMFSRVDASGGDDYVWVRKVTATDVANGSKDTITFSPALIGYYPVSSLTIQKVNSIDVGSTVTQPFLSAKAVGSLVDGSQVEILLPKIRITKGFTMAFNSEQFGNLPYEIEVLDLVPADAFYANFKNRKASISLT